MKEIPLTRLGGVALVDDEDYDFLNQFTWASVKNTTGSMIYATRCVRVPGPKPTTVTIYMHRQLLCPPRSLRVDHADRNGLHNCKANLRYATHAQNMQNRIMPRAQAPYRGIRPNGNGWQAYIKDGARQRTMGTYADPAEAARVYDDKAKELHGEFAVLNFPG